MDSPDPVEALAARLMDQVAAALDALEYANQDDPAVRKAVEILTRQQS